MADNYLITGYWGEPHVTAENDRGINAGIYGSGRVVLPVGEQFRAEYIGNNTVRLYDGKLMDGGAAAGIPAGEYVDLLIANAGQGMNRNDLIAFQYEQDASTLIERGSFVVVQGTETSGTAVDPVLTQDNLLSGHATFDQMPLWRVAVSGAAISAPVQVFGVFGVVALGEDGKIPQSQLPTFSETHTASISTSWTSDGTNGGYTKTVSVSGILATDNPIVDIVLDTNRSTNKAQVEAWSKVTRITTENGSIKLWANEEKPATAFTLQLKVVR